MTGLRFSLRSLLLLFIILGVALLVWMWDKPHRDAQELAEAAGRLGGKVEYNSGAIMPSHGPKWAIQYIDLTDCVVSNEGVDQLLQLPGAKRLPHLILARTPVSDAALEHITECRSLNALDLSNTAVGNATLKRLGGLPKLSTLNVTGTEITDDGLLHLPTPWHWNELHLSYTKVSDDGLRHLVRLARISHLSLEGCRITDEGLKQLRRLSELDRVDLRRCLITDEGLMHLAGTKGLDKLYLSPKGITFEGYERFKASHGDCWLFSDTYIPFKRSDFNETKQEEPAK